jgi:hypothetical protein
VKVPPLAVGAGGGLLLALLLAPSTGTALGNLASARADRAKFAALAGGQEPARAPLVAPGLAAGEDIALLTTRIRSRAHDAGVLVEEIRTAKDAGGLIRIRVSFSGTEKAVVALADALERETVLVRLQNWKLVPIEGGLRLTGDALAVKK